MGSKSSSSSSSTSVTNQADNRVAATDEAVALGAGASLDASTKFAGSPITVTNSSADEGIAEQWSKALATGLREAGETSRAAIQSNRDVSGQGLTLAGAVADDGFDITRSVVQILADTAAEVVDTVDEAARSNSAQSYSFAGRVLEGYEDARLSEAERKFNQIMTAALTLGIAGVVAWAYVKGR